MHTSGLKINFKQIHFSFPRLYQTLTTGTHRNSLPVVSCQCWRNSILHLWLLSRTLIRRNAGWIVYTLRRNCITQHVDEWKIEERIAVKGRRRIRRKQLLDKLEETIGYWPLKVEALDRTIWWTGCRRDYGPVTRQTMNNASFLFSVRCVETDVVNVTLPLL